MRLLIIILILLYLKIKLPRGKFLAHLDFYPPPLPRYLKILKKIKSQVWKHFIVQLYNRSRPKHFIMLHINANFIIFFYLLNYLLGKCLESNPSTTCLCNLESNLVWPVFLLTHFATRCRSSNLNQLFCFCFLRGVGCWVVEFLGMCYVI